MATGSKERLARQRLLERVRKGLRPEQAAAACRIRKAEFDALLADEDFALDVFQAEALFVEDNIDAIKAACEDKPHLWASRGWLLERIRPDDFAQRVMHALVSKQLGLAIEEAANVLPREHLVRLVEAWAARFGVDLALGDTVEVQASAAAETKH